VSIGKISLEANMNEFADDQVTKTKIYIDKMNESTTMFPVIVTLNELPNQVLEEGVMFVLISKLEWRNFEMFMSSIFVKSEYCKSNRALQSWDKFG